MIIKSLLVVLFGRLISPISFHYDLIYNILCQKIVAKREIYIYEYSDTR